MNTISSCKKGSTVSSAAEKFLALNAEVPYAMPSFEFV